jgi:hypothetical protein
MSGVVVPPQSEAEMPQDIDALQGSTSVVFSQVGLSMQDLRVVGPRLERSAGDRPDPGDGGVVEQPGQQP